MFGEIKHMISTTELVQQIAEDTNVEKSVVKNVLKSFWDVVKTNVENGEEIRFIGTGKFYKAHRDARAGHNPRTGEKITIEASDKLAFKSATYFRS